MPTNLIVALTLAGGAIALLTFFEWRLWRRMRRSNGNCVPMPPPGTRITIPMPYRYDLVITSGGGHAMMPSPNGGWIHWRDADKNGVAFEPIAISDRLPRDSECELDEFCVLWCWAFGKSRSAFRPCFWHKVDIRELRSRPDWYSHWLPSKAILVPFPDTTPPTKPQPTGGRLIKEPRP